MLKNKQKFEQGLARKWTKLYAVLRNSSGKSVCVPHRENVFLVVGKKKDLTTRGHETIVIEEMVDHKSLFFSLSLRC